MEAQKTTVINIRLTQDELAAVDALAQEEERKRAPMIVRLVREAIRKREAANGQTQKA